MSNEQCSQISTYVEQTIIQWVRQYQFYENTKNIISLVDGKFFLTILETLPNFKLLCPIIQLTDQSNLAKKVNVIKNITKSLIKYHQLQLVRDVSELDINYVELCMGNKKELFRLITLVLSAVWSQASSRRCIENTIQKLAEDRGEVIRIMIQNSIKIGQECTSCESRSSKQSQQKKIMIKIQILQNRIEELQILNRNLQQKIKINLEKQQNLVQQNHKIKNQMEKYQRKYCQVYQINQKIGNQLKISKIQENKICKINQIVKKKLEEKISQYQTYIEQLNKQLQKYQIIKSKNHQICQINTQIKLQNQNLRQKIDILQNEKIEYKKSQKIKTQQFIILKQHCSDLQLKIQQLSLSLVCNCKQQDLSINKNKHQNIKQLQNSSDSNRYCIKQNLHWLANHHDYIIDQQFQNNISDINYQKFINHDHFSIKTITERSLEDSSYLEYVKQNQSIFINNQDVFQLHQSGFQENNMKQQKQLDSHMLKSQNFVQFEKRYEQQIYFLTSIINDLLSQLQQVKKTNPIVIMQNNSMTNSRLLKFTNKVRSMFKKDEGKDKQQKKQTEQIKRNQIYNKSNNLKNKQQPQLSQIK